MGRTVAQGQWLRWGGLIVIMTIATLRCVIVFAPQVMFDVDPYSNPAPLGGLGPGGSLLLDVMLLAACGFALIGHARSGGSIDWLLYVLGLLPGPVMLWHGFHDASDLWRGSTWSAAAIAGATIAHLARDRTTRLVIIALLASIIVPLLFRGANQMTFEHAAMVKLYDETREQFLAERGWEPDSSAARIYERRLRQPEPVGWFTTTNIFATFTGFGLVFCTGLAVACARARMQSGWPGLMGLCAIASGVALWMTGSRGALGAAVIGIGAGVILDFGFAIVDTRQSKIQSPTSKILFSPLPLGLIALALLAIIIHGTLLPDSVRNLSLLFRWQYMVAAARVFIDHPWVGVGPDGFQQAYTFHRVPTNPEEVSSAHSVFIDWLTMLGVAGAAWVALVFLWIMRASAAAATRKIASPQPIANLHRVATRSAIAVALLAFAPALLIEWSMTDLRSLMVRGLGAGGFITLAILLVQILDHVGFRQVQAWLAAAIIAVLVHAQIEMTFFQPGTIVWLMCALGVAAGARTRLGAPSTVAPWLIALTIFLQSIWIAGAGAWPALLMERRMLSAAAVLERAREQQVTAEQLANARQTAAAALAEAYELWPSNVKPLEAAVLQLDLAGADLRSPHAFGALTLAALLADRAVDEHGKTSSMALAVTAHVKLAMANAGAANAAPHWQQAIEYARKMTELDPHGIGSWKRLGDVWWLHGERNRAAAAYRRALENDANFALDELKQLSDRNRRELRKRIGEADEAPGAIS